MGGWDGRLNTGSQALRKILLELGGEPAFGGEG